MIIRKPLRPFLAEDNHERPHRIILHLDMDAFFALIEQRTHPEWRNKPLIVAGHSMTRGVVCAASYEIRPYGVKSGMPLAEARQLCPQAIIAPMNGVKYLDTAKKIFAHLENYTPLVEIFSIDEAFLDVTGTHQSYDSPYKLVEHIKDWIRKNFGLTASVGMAPNKILAKLATEQRKPDGFFEIKPADVERFLENLPAENLCGIGSRLKEHLNEMGVFTCGQLGQTPEKQLLERFGILGSVLKRMGQGRDNSPVLSVRSTDEVKSMGHSYTLLHNTSKPQIIRKYLRWLAEKVGARLRQDGYEGKTVALTVRFSQFKTITQRRTLDYYLNDGELIYSEVLKILDSVNTGERIRLLGVSVSHLRLASVDNWLLSEIRKRNQLVRSIDTINAKYGDFTLKPAQLDFREDQKISSGLLPLFGQGREEHEFD